MKTRVKKTAVKRSRKKPMINNIYKSLIIFLTIIYSRIQVIAILAPFFECSNAKEAYEKVFHPG